MNKFIPLTAFMASVAIADEPSQPHFEPQIVAHTGNVHVAAPPAQAFQLFTAPGEKLWISDWDPKILSGGDGRAEGAVFVTEHGHEQTIWVVVDYQPESLFVRYARVTPASRAGTVAVTASSDGEGGTNVQVNYELTALNERGNADLAHFDAARFESIMLEWEKTIRSTRIDFASLN